MAAKNIKGITIEIGGDTTDLQKALQKPEKDARSLQSELREINNSLKFNPDSLELLAQKSTVLGQEVAAVSEKLKVLKDSQAQVAAQAASGEIGEEQYRAFNREVEKTSNQLNNLKIQLQDNGREIKRVADETEGAARGTQSFSRAVDEQRKAVESANRSSEEHGKSVRKLKEDYEDAGNSALTFSEAVKAATIGNLFADGIRDAASALWDFAGAGAASARDMEVNERKLELVLRNTVDASDQYIDSIKRLIDEEERLGVVSANSQTAAAQELATYVTRKGTLEGLIPILNDMTAQQYGVNASQEQSVTVATALGKTLDGQVGSLTRWGYRFSEAEQEILKTGTEMQKLDVITKVVTDSVGGLNHGLRDTTDEGRAFSQTLDLQAAQREFGKNVEKIKNDILLQLLPTFSDGVRKINDILEKNQDTIQRLGDVVVTVVDALTRLLSVLLSIPGPILGIVGGMVLAIRSFSTAKRGIETLSDVFKIFGSKGISPTTIKILALIAAVSVLLFLIIALKEGTDKASKAISDMGNVAGQATNSAQQGVPRGYATGTRSAARGWAWVGEEGPELVRFRGGEQVYTASQSRQLAQASGPTSESVMYGDSHYNISVNGIQQLNQVVDWFENRRLRRRADGN